MKTWKALLALGLVAAVSTVVACGGEDIDDTSDGGGADGGDQGGGTGGDGGTGGGGGGTGGDGGGGPCTEVSVSADVTADTTWTADECYTLTTHIFVQAPAVLTIEAGTLVKGEAGSSLVVTKGAKIEAVGTAAAPIVFTSAKAPGSRGRGDWGGVVLLGEAPINAAGGTNSIEGFPASAGTAIEYGGDDAADDSGTLKYVRIEFGGFELAPDNELNGLSLGGVGSGTELDFVQIHMGADDGVEFFGGTVNAKHLVVTYADDDSVDWDMGFKGNIQYLVIAQEPTAGDAGYESDNSEDAHDEEPRSEPTIWNATLVGSGAQPGQAAKTQRAAVLRRGTGAHLHNHLVTGFADFAIDVRDDASVALVATGQLEVTGSIFYGNNGGEDWDNADADKPDQDGGFDEGAAFGAGTNRSVDPMLTAPFDLDAPDFTPMAGSPALTGGDTPPGGFFDASATFVGAIGTDNWLAGWTAYPAD